MIKHTLNCLFMYFQEFRKLLVQVHNSLSQNEMLELVFLCSDILKKDLSDVVTARDLFSLLQKRDLLSSDDSSLLVELLKIIKRDQLIRDLQLNPELSRSRVSPFRSVQHFGGTSFGTSFSNNVLYMLLFVLLTG